MLYNPSNIFKKKHLHCILDNTLIGGWLTILNYKYPLHALVQLSASPALALCSLRLPVLQALSERHDLKPPSEVSVDAELVLVASHVVQKENVVSG
jgi:hypothetical protein